MESGLRDVKMPTVTQVLYNDLGFEPGPVSDSKTHEATLPPTTNGIDSKVTGVPTEEREMPYLSVE